MMANGLLSSLTKESKGTSDAFKAVLEGMFPFMEKNKGLEDQKLKELMEAEVAKGPLHFSPVVMKPLRAAMKKFEISDDFKERLSHRVKRRTA